MSSDAFTLVSRAMARVPRGIICDIDGTLAPIAATPDAARLAPGAADALKSLAKSIDLVAVVSGRGARDAQALVGVPGVLVMGNHGLESLVDGELTIHPDAVASMPGLREALDAIRKRVKVDQSLAGVLVEDKGVSGSIHYRLANDRPAAESKINDLATDLAAQFNLIVTHGRFVIELRPPVAVNKGSAVRRIVDAHQLQGVVFFGDDVTDVDGFNELKVLRHERAIEACAIGVADPEARPDVIEAADAAVGGVTECVALLAEIANKVAAGNGTSS